MLPAQNSCCICKKIWYNNRRKSFVVQIKAGFCVYYTICIARSICRFAARAMADYTINTACLWYNTILTKRNRLQYAGGQLVEKAQRKLGFLV